MGIVGEPGTKRSYGLALRVPEGCAIRTHARPGCGAGLLFRIYSQTKYKESRPNRAATFRSLKEGATLVGGLYRGSYGVRVGRDLSSAVSNRSRSIGKKDGQKSA